MGHRDMVSIQESEINAGAPEQTVTFTGATCVLQSFDGGTIMMDSGKFHDQPQSSFHQQHHPPQFNQCAPEKVGFSSTARFLTLIELSENFEQVLLDMIFLL